MNSTDYWIGLADNNRTFVLYRVGNVVTSVIQEEQSGGFDIDTTFNWDLSVAWELQEYIFSGSIALVTNGWTHGLSSSYCYRRVHNTTSIKEGANQVDKVYLEVSSSKPRSNSIFRCARRRSYICVLTRWVFSHEHICTYTWFFQVLILKALY